MFLAAVVSLVLGSTPLRAEHWYKVKVEVPNVKTLNQIQNSDLCFMDCVPHLGTMDVAIGPGEESKLTAGGYKFRYVAELEDPRNWEATHGSGSVSDSDDYRFQYFNADQILAFYEGLRASYPRVVTRLAIGTSVNGETMWAYGFGLPALSSSSGNVVIQSLIHAREWISGASVMHIASQLAKSLSLPQLSSVPPPKVWIIPMANPDGYRYTWTNDRLWRKNRRPNGGSSFGVDVNRNYSKGWGLNGGSSSNVNSETYRGTAAFSEPESQAVRNFVQSLPNVLGFIDYHSYGQLVLQPWGYTTAVPPNVARLNSIGSAVKAEMDGFGATYTTGETSVILYIASGTSNDYVFDLTGAPAFGVELRDTGEDGFLLPAGQIYATQDEAWAGFRKYLSLVR